MLILSEIASAGISINDCLRTNKERGSSGHKMFTILKLILQLTQKVYIVICESTYCLSFEGQAI